MQREKNNAKEKSEERKLNFEYKRDPFIRKTSCFERSTEDKGKISKLKIK